MDTQKGNQKQSLFRQKALSKVTSPEELDHYLKVTGPGIWLPLIAVIVLLSGIVAWMVFGHIPVTINVAVESTGNTVICYVADEQKGNAIRSGYVTIAGNQYALSDVGYANLLVTEKMDSVIIGSGVLETGTVVKPLAVDAQLAEGVYSGKITVEAIHPIRYIIN